MPTVVVGCACLPNECWASSENYAASELPLPLASGPAESADPLNSPTAVSLTCTGLPSEASCSSSPVKGSGPNTTVNAIITVTSTAAHTTMLVPSQRRYYFAATCGGVVPLAGMVLLAAPKRKRWITLTGLMGACAAGCDPGLRRWEQRRRRSNSSAGSRNAGGHLQCDANRDGGNAFRASRLCANRTVRQNRLHAWCCLSDWGTHARPALGCPLQSRCSVLARLSL